MLAGKRLKYISKMSVDKDNEVMLGVTRIEHHKFRNDRNTRKLVNILLLFCICRIWNEPAFFAYSSVTFRRDLGLPFDCSFDSSLVAWLPSNQSVHFKPTQPDQFQRWVSPSCRRGYFFKGCREDGLANGTFWLELNNVSKLYTLLRICVFCTTVYFIHLFLSQLLVTTTRNSSSFYWAGRHILWFDIILFSEFDFDIREDERNGFE